MKNKILLVVVFLIGIFLSTTSVDALTRIEFSEKNNGQINTTLHFEEGFVGAIDITFNVSGDVYVKDFKFSDKITSGNYETYHKYNSDKHTLTVRVTTGGVGTSHNLLNSKKELALGTIIFDSSAKKDVNYKLSETAFKIVDNNWKSKTVEQSHIQLGDKTEFVYTVNKVEEDPKDDDKDKEDEGKEDEGKEDNTTSDENTSSKEDSKDDDSSNGSTTTTDKGNNTDKSNGKDNNSSNDEKDDDSITDDEENTTDEEVYGSGSVDKKEKDKNKDEFNWILALVIVVLAVGIICLGIYFLLIKRKKEEEKDNKTNKTNKKTK